MRIGPYRVTADLGHLAFLALMVVFCVWYLLDARAASTETENMLLIFPAVVVALVLAAAILFEAVHISRVEPAGGGSAPPEEKSPFDWRVPTLIALLVLFVVSMQFLAYDVATIAFVFLSLFLQGERRWTVLLGYAIVFSVALTYAFKMMLSLEFPTLLF